MPSIAAVADAGFELPALTAGSFRYAPTGSPWTFSGGAGVATNGSGFTAGNPNAPLGGQVAFLQQQSSITQAVALAPSTYSISFAAAQRGNGGGAQTIQVVVDGIVVGTFNNVSGTAFRTLTTSSFTLAGNVHTISFRGTNLNGGDNTMFIDRVAINQEPVGLSDSGMEMPAVSQGTFQYDPTGTPWVFQNGAGVASNGSGFTAANPAAPQGNQVAMLQQLASMSEAVSFVAGTYAIKFSAAQRGGQAGNQTFRVLVDGGVVGTFNNVSGTAYTLQSTSTFTVGDGSHTVTFEGTNLNGGDNTILLDQIAVESQTTGLNDSGFETAAQAAGTFAYSPTGSSWIFGAGAGIASNGSGFTASNPNSPQGSQVLFLQRGGSVSQPVTMAAGTYTIGLSAAQRANLPSAQTLQILVDGAVVGSYNNLASTSYMPLTTSSFTVADGSHTITLQATNLYGGDNTMLIDRLRLIPQAIALNDSGFESPALALAGFKYSPAGSAWSFSGTAGVAGNLSAFTAGNAAAPQGNQVAFLQREGSMSQTLSLAAGTYTVNFVSAQRGNQRSAQTFQVLLDGTVIGTFDNDYSTTYTAQSTGSFTVQQSGLHSITIQGTNANGGDNTIFIDQVSIMQPVAGLSDTGFEAPALAAGAFGYRPAGSPWSFLGTAGVAANVSPFTSGNPLAPDGNQAGVIQQAGAIGQNVTLAAGAYAINFAAAQRGNGGGSQTIQVLVDGNVVGEFNNLAGKGYSWLTTSEFSVGDGTHTITFQGTNLKGGDNTMLIDNVSLAAV